MGVNARKQYYPNPIPDGFYSGNTDDPPKAIVKSNSGHLRVTVSPEKATVDYVRAFLPGDGINGHIEHSYSITKDDTFSDIVKEVKKNTD
jgi:hypothetical protein